MKMLLPTKLETLPRQHASAPIPVVIEELTRKVEGLTIQIGRVAADSLKKEGELQAQISRQEQRFNQMNVTAMEQLRALAVETQDFRKDQTTLSTYDRLLAARKEDCDGLRRQLSQHTESLNSQLRELIEQTPRKTEVKAQLSDLSSEINEQIQILRNRLKKLEDAPSSGRQGNDTGIMVGKKYRGSTSKVLVNVARHTAGFALIGQCEHCGSNVHIGVTPAPGYRWPANLPSTGECPRCIDYRFDCQVVA
jgi:DNA repair exonuclease SbcCD ATPase subunit